MVSGMDLAQSGINRLVRSLEGDGVTVRHINAAMIGTTIRRMVDELGEAMTVDVLRCVINEIEDGAYGDDYIAPEARMIDEDARERRKALTVIEGGGGGSKV